MGSIETLTTDTCLGLLGTSTIGRLGLMINGYPHIFPVNYVLDGSLVTFRTGPGTKFDESQHGTVCFQVDQTEAAGRAAWSVLVLGAVRIPDLRESNEMQRLQRLEITPLAPGDKPHLIQIVPDQITGRRVVADAAGSALDPRGYLGLYY
jgi:nitroimidazol reductase NimA-like FMN-containing flavoprotein (pyridoxamine 5'-phosphate oxidase superfamily)